MTFWVILIGFIAWYHFDYYFMGDKRYRHIEEQVEQFEKDGLQTYLSKQKGKRQSLFENRYLSIHITQKNDKIEVKTYVKSAFDERALIHHLTIDSHRQEVVKDVLKERNLASFWGSDTGRIALIHRLRNVLIRETNRLFDLSVPIVEDTHLTEKPFPKQDETNKTPLSSLLPLLVDGQFRWEENEKEEVYTTFSDGYTIHLSSNSGDMHHFTIRQHTQEKVTIHYNPNEKAIHHMDIQKDILHQLDDPEPFIAVMERVLYFCYEQTNAKQTKIQAHIEQFNQKPYQFLAKEKEVNELVQYIDTHASILGMEDKHLFRTIKEEKLPELFAFKQTLSSRGPSVEQELLSMVDILLELLRGIQSRIDQDQKRTLLIQERLMEKMKKE